MFGSLGGIPLHPLVVHAVVIFVTLACVGVIALAIVPGWRHRFGSLLLWVDGVSVLCVLVAVYSGYALTEVPGLGTSTHAEGGRFLMFLVFPLALLTGLMVLLDRLWLVRVNKHGDMYRLNEEDQPLSLIVVCVFCVLMALIVMFQTILVGHSGAEASWGDVIVSG
jgi:hypothetical protein